MIRIDIFSAKGGVGKTSVGYRLARTWANRTEQSVLLVDADLTGTCVGDLLEPWVNNGWHKQPNLIHLVCGCPEELPEHISESTLPVYEARSAPPVDNTEPMRVNPATPAKTVLFCPSHADTHLGTGENSEIVNLAVIQALLGHESAGGWVRYVIDQVIKSAGRFAKELGLVVVDHGPGIGALQWAEMTAIEKENEEATNAGNVSKRMALFVASRDSVDLAASKAINLRMKTAQMTHLEASAIWVLNRLPAKWADTNVVAWRSSLGDELKQSIGVPTPDAPWIRRAFPLFEEQAMGNAYAKAELVGYCNGQQDEPMNAIYNQIRALSSPATVKS